jgi:RNA polymerase sigma-70 factor (ECF subfamily)
VVNLTREHHRRQNRWRLLPFRPALEPDPQVEAERQLADREMAEALHLLSPREREAVYLRYFQDAAYGEVATIMQVSESTSRVLVHRALEKLRKLLESEQSKREK